jgi:lycopene beta-cyclase
MKNSDNQNNRANAEQIDIAIVGGGLAGCLIAYGLHIKRPDLTVRVIEAAPTLGGNHVWSFFSTDIRPEHRWLVEPFVLHRWHGYQVCFPAHNRTLGAQYNTIRSQDFDQRVRALLPPETIIEAKAQRLGPTHVTLASGRQIDAGGVIDARGPARFNMIDAKWQKFVGQEYRTTKPHGLKEPIIMDATIDQIDGYRFIYVLPFADDRLFVEDTYYSDTPKLDRSALRQRLTRYTDEKGWQISEILHEEEGVLPVILGGDFEALWSGSTPGVAKAGGRAGLFHPTTGFSLPTAVRTAAMITDLSDFSGEALHRALHDHALAQWKSGGFYRMLDRMLFLDSVAPDQRYKIMQRFYRLSPRLIERFYAGTTVFLDKLRVLTGKPPVPIREAMKVIQEKS